MSDRFLARFENKIARVSKDGSIQRRPGKGGAKPRRSAGARGRPAPRRPSPVRNPAQGSGVRSTRVRPQSLDEMEAPMDEPEGGMYGDDPFMGGGGGGAMFSVGGDEVIAGAGDHFAPAYAAGPVPAGYGGPAPAAPAAAPAYGAPARNGRRVSAGRSSAAGGGMGGGGSYSRAHNPGRGSSRSRKVTQDGGGGAPSGGGGGGGGGGYSPRMARGGQVARGGYGAPAGGQGPVYSATPQPAVVTRVAAVAAHPRSATASPPARRRSQPTSPRVRQQAGKSKRPGIGDLEALMRQADGGAPAAAPVAAAAPPRPGPPTDLSHSGGSGSAGAAYGGGGYGASPSPYGHEASGYGSATPGGYAASNGGYGDASLVDESSYFDGGRASAAGPEASRAERRPARRRKPKRSKDRPKPAPKEPKFRDMSYLNKEKYAFEDGEYNPRAANEERATDAETALYYSRKARAVEYRPRTLQEYKQVQPKKYYQLGKLGPDLNSEDLVAKRANTNRVKEFSKQLREVNRHKVAKTKRNPPPPPAPVVKEKSAREKAREFAERVPKPKVVRRRDDGEPRRGKGKGRGRRPGAGAEMSKVEKLELEHDEMRADVDAIRREFGL